jgi:hypothetical protein
MRTIFSATDTRNAPPTDIENNFDYLNQGLMTFGEQEAVGRYIEAVPEYIDWLRQQPGWTLEQILPDPEPEDGGDTGAPLGGLGKPIGQQQAQMAASLEAAATVAAGGDPTEMLARLGIPEQTYRMVGGVMPEGDE